MNKPFKPDKAYKNINFLNSKIARPIRILSEYYEPYQRLKNFDINATIVFFGSARIVSRNDAQKMLTSAEKTFYKKGSEKNQIKLKKAKTALELSYYYEQAREFSKRITTWTMDKKAKKQKYYLCSGGGPGIMEAANRGALEAGGKSIGLNISLPMEQFPNTYITTELSFEFHYFFMRKYFFLYFAKAIVVFPGGFGTLDEMMEVLTLIQTKKVNKHLSIIIFGKKFWSEIINLDAMQKWGVISKKDLKLFTFVDSVDEAMDFLTQNLPH